jgi:hypothetical protein
VFFENDDEQLHRKGKLADVCETGWACRASETTMRVARVRVFSILLCIFPATLSAQKISIGLVGGLGITNDYSGSGTRVYPFTFSRIDSVDTVVRSTTGRDFLIGPEFEIIFRHNFSLEVDAIHRRRILTEASTYAPPLVFGSQTLATYTNKTDGSTWDIPVLAKYQLPSFRGAFVEGGAAFRPWLYYVGNQRYGFVTGAGVKLHAHNLEIEPTMRYTRWGTSTPLYSPGIPAKPDQLEFLVGVSQPSESIRPSVFGRKLNVGLIGGFGLTGDFHSTSSYPSAKSKMVGFAMGVNLPRRFGIEVDGLYHPLILSEGQRSTALTWEFPVLTKYKLSTGGFQPLVELGPSFRSLGNLNNTSPGHYGVTAGLGGETRWRWVTVSPVVRFTRWAADGGPEYAGLSGGATIRNQVQLLFGFSF